MRALSEDNFTNDYVLPMLRARYRGVYYNHGTDEFGRDVLFWHIDEMGDRRDKGAQIKIGNISGSTGSVQELIGQARAAFSVPMIDESSVQRNICELYIITSGQIASNAKTQILTGLGIPYANIIHFWNGERVLQEISELDKEILEYSVWEKLMADSGLPILLRDPDFIRNLNENLLPACAGDQRMSPCQIADSLRVMLGALPVVSQKLDNIAAFPKQREAILWNLSWVIVSKAYYRLGDVKKFVFE
jgi:hypothetical protein